MGVNLTALKAELEADPTARGYAPHLAAGRFGVVTDLVNAIRAGGSVNRTLVPAWEFVTAIVPAEYAALPSQAHRDYLSMVASAGQVQLGAGAVRDALTIIFGAGTTTRANLLKLLTRPASRAEELFGSDTVVRVEDCALAIREG